MSPTRALASSLSLASGLSLAWSLSLCVLPARIANVAVGLRPTTPCRCGADGRASRMRQAFRCARRTRFAFRRSNMPLGSVSRKVSGTAMQLPRSICSGGTRAPPSHAQQEQNRPPDLRSCRAHLALDDEAGKPTHAELVLDQGDEIEFERRRSVAACLSRG